MYFSQGMFLLGFYFWLLFLLTDHGALYEISQAKLAYRLNGSYLGLGIVLVVPPHRRFFHIHLFLGFFSHVFFCFCNLFLNLYDAVGIN